MLICLSYDEKIKSVADYCDSNNIFCDFINLSEYESIKTAVTKNRTVANYDHILFYCEESTGFASELPDVIGYLKRYYHARIIVFAPDNPNTIILFGKLAELGLRELAAVSDETDITRELKECLSPDGKGYAQASEFRYSAQVEQARAYIRPAFVIPQDLRLCIGVAGTQPRTGVTTQVFSLYHALAFLGFSPCVIDVNQSFIESLMMLYGDAAERNGSVIRIEGMDFSHDLQVGTGHNVFLYDFGELCGENIEMFRGCDLRMLCAGTKPWEMLAFAAKDSAYGCVVDMILFSFASQREREMIGDLQLSAATAYTPWNPDIWEHTNKDWHEMLLIPFLKERFPA